VISEQQKQERDVDAKKHVHEQSYPRRLLVANSYLILKKGHRYLPPIVRAILGLVLVVLGLLGFLPILGFWMIPLGLALIATDIPPFGRWLKQRLRHKRHNKKRT